MKSELEGQHLTKPFPKFVMSSPGSSPSNLLPDIFSINVADYKDFLPQLLHTAKEEFYGLGFPFGHRPPPPQAASIITATMRFIFGDLQRLLGERTYPVYCTDPIAPDSWWRQWFRKRNPLPIDGRIRSIYFYFQNVS